MTAGKEEKNVKVTVKSGEAQSCSAQRRLERTWLFQSRQLVPRFELPGKSKNRFEQGKKKCNAFAKQKTST